MRHLRTLWSEKKKNGDKNIGGCSWLRRKTG